MEKGKKGGTPAPHRVVPLGFPPPFVPEKDPWGQVEQIFHGPDTLVVTQPTM